MERLTEILKHYGVHGEISNISEGPLVKLIEFKPEPGTKLKTVTSALDDIARELGIPSLRVEAIEKNGTIGFEVPAAQRKNIDFKSLLSSQDFIEFKGDLPIIFGTDITGKPVIADLASMPHLLVAGTTGSGKSVGLNTFILSLIAKKKPADLKFILIDPKRIEFSIYNRQKYMLAPVVTEMTDADNSLAYLVSEMERRYGLFEEAMVKNISEYNSDVGHLPYIVCVIDEFADLMAANKKTAAAVQRLAQKSRAAGIHIILATQRPSVDVVTGVIKANFPCRLAYKTASAADSRTIIDGAGAEKLLGRGDALYLAADGLLKRVHGAYLPGREIAMMLEPYRGEVQPLPVISSKTAPSSKTKGNSSVGFFKSMWNFWASLRQKDKKLILNGLAFLFGLVTGNKKKK